MFAALASLIAAIFWGSNTVFGKILTKKADYWDLTVFRYIGGSIILIFFNFIALSYNRENFDALFEKFTTFAPMFPGAGAPLAIPIEMSGMVAIIFVAIFTGGIIPLALYYFGLKYSKASIGGFAELAFPVLAIFVNYAFLGFTLSTSQFIGAAILVGTVTWLVFINRKEHQEEKQEEKILSDSD